MIGETQQQQAPSSDLDFSTLTPIDSGKPANAGSTLRQSVAFGVQQNPDEYAKLIKQQQVTGMSPEVAKPFANDTQNAIDVERLNPEGMVDSHPRTAQWATNPDNARCPERTSCTGSRGSSSMPHRCVRTRRPGKTRSRCGAECL
jgi:hypothetical protein